ncbi:hypothetical protein [Leisingera sp. F5]|uniref:hypothetical protein n=1 Tax=Leisingera sp. F5 TaxID=1813816 RepID=UPI0025C15110|nr:hypothetical protein [Leisingera sp. F5]
MLIVRRLLLHVGERVGPQQFVIRGLRGIETALLGRLNQVFKLLLLVLHGLPVGLDLLAGLRDFLHPLLDVLLTGIAALQFFQRYPFFLAVNLDGEKLGLGSYLGFLVFIILFAVVIGVFRIALIVAIVRLIFLKIRCVGGFCMVVLRVVFGFRLNQAVNHLIKGHGFSRGIRPGADFSHL